jgi:hypothetical protein
MSKRSLCSGKRFATARVLAVWASLNRRYRQGQLPQQRFAQTRMIFLQPFSNRLRQMRHRPHPAYLSQAVAFQGQEVTLILALLDLPGRFPHLASILLDGSLHIVIKAKVITGNTEEP